MHRPGERMVQLLDGRQVSSWSEEWRRECYDREMLALDIARLPDKDDRRARVAQVRAEQGELAAERLVARLVELRPRIDAERAAQGSQRVTNRSPGGAGRGGSPGRLPMQRPRSVAYG